LSVRRLPDPPRRPRRLVVCGMTAALLVVPGVAHAGDAPSPANSLTTVTDQLGGAAEGLAGELAGGTGQSTGTGRSESVVPGTASTSTAPGAPSLDPAQLQALLAQLGVSPECATAIQGDVVATLASIPATVQQLIALLGDTLTELQADPENGPALLQEALTDLLGGAVGGGGATTTAPAGLPLLTALEDLVQDFLTVCLPQPAAGTTPPAPISTAPAAATTPPAAAAPTSVAPVAYLGYAPTGTEGDSDDSSALALLGSVLLLTGGAAGSWMWSRRAASSRG
jgi:hypothetical protein